MKLRKSPQTSIVLAEFLHRAHDWKYGYDQPQYGIEVWHFVSHPDAPGGAEAARYAMGDA